VGTGPYPGFSGLRRPGPGWYLGTQRMAESNANRPTPDAVTAEDADRLSERFRPSWEAEGQPAPAPPRAPPAPAPSPMKQTLLGGGGAPSPGPVPRAPAAPVPQRPAAPAPAAPQAAAPQPARPAPAPAPTRVAPVVNVGATSSSPAGAAAADLMRRATLAGISPGQKKSTDRSAAAPDDLDWELPPSVQAAADALDVTLDAPTKRTDALSKTQPLAPRAPAAKPPAEPEEPMQVDVEELPPESKPSGIGQTYKPRDQDAPPVVLTEEVQRTEAQARAMLEAQHRARSAPTIQRMPAVRATAAAPSTKVLDADLETLAPRKSRAGVWIALVVAVLALVGGAVVVLTRPKAPPPEATVTTKPAPVAPDTRAPPPPELPPAPAVTPPPEPVAAQPTESAAPAEPPAPLVEAKAPPTPPSDVEEPTTKRPEPVAARTLKPKPAAPKPPATAKPPAPTKPPAAPKPAGKASGVIVRDNPF